MSHRVAFASSDGKVVNQHFGKTKKFLIVDIEEDGYKFIEVRENDPACSGFEHSDDALFSSVELIKDCEAVFVAKIGQGAIAKLDSRGIQAVEAPHFIEDIIDNLLHGKVKLAKLG